MSDAPLTNPASTGAALAPVPSDLPRRRASLTGVEWKVSTASLIQLVDLPKDLRQEPQPSPMHSPQPAPATPPEPEHLLIHSGFIRGPVRRRLGPTSV